MKSAVHAQAVQCCKVCIAQHVSLIVALKVSLLFCYVCHGMTTQCILASSDCEGWQSNGAFQHQSQSMGSPQLPGQCCCNCCLVTRYWPLAAGDEYAQTRNGNNNYYGHDTELTRFDWEKLDKVRDSYFRFYRQVLRTLQMHDQDRQITLAVFTNVHQCLFKFHLCEASIVVLPSEDIRAHMQMQAMHQKQ